MRADRLAVVGDCVHRIEPQAVTVELGEPVECVVHHEVPHRAAVATVEVDGRAPGGVVPAAEELGRIQ